MQDLRRVPFLISVCLVLLVVSAETGGLLVKSPAQSLGGVCGGLISSDMLAQIGIDLEGDEGKQACADADKLRSDVKGLGVPSLAFVDGILLFIMIFMAVGLLVPESITGRVQGIVTLVFSILLLLAVIVMIIGALAQLLLMVSLLLAVPFGTIAYFAIYASFPRSAMLGLLSGIMLLKIAAVATLLIGQQRFLQNKALVLLILTSFAAGLIVSFLLGFVPGFLASITDALAAIVIGIIAAIWLLVLLISSIPAIIKAVA
jgi:hypothetical protein